MGRRSHTQKAGWGTRFAYAIADHLDRIGYRMVEGASDRAISIDAKNICGRHRETYLELAWGFASLELVVRGRKPMAGPPTSRGREAKPKGAGFEVSADAPELLCVERLLNNQRCRACEDAKAARSGTTEAALSNLNRAVADLGRVLGLSLCDLADGLRRLASAGSLRAYLAQRRRKVDFDSFDQDKPGRLRGDASALGGRFTRVEDAERPAPGDGAGNPESQGE